MVTNDPTNRIPLPIKSHDHIIGVGWLSRGVPFATGTIGRPIYERLKSLCKNPWQPFVLAGYHECDLCEFEGVHNCANLFLPAENRIFVAPAMIAHYINCHQYRPPDDFCEAVMACPEMRSNAFHKALVRTGLLQNIVADDSLSSEQVI